MTDVDQRLVTLWTNLLECSDAGPDSDFFDCGGTSVTAVHLAASIQETFGISVDAIEVVVSKRLSALSELIMTRLGGIV